jgi:hypothetical protein
MPDYKPVPIEAAIAIAEAYDKDQVVIVVWDNAHETAHVTTFGKTDMDSQQAAMCGNSVKRALGWPEELCKDKPKRSHVAHCTKHGLVAWIVAQSGLEYCPECFTEAAERLRASMRNEAG